MIRGTTPTNTFEVDADLREAVALFITYSQMGKVKFEKVIGDVTIEETQLETELTQQETLSLDSGSVEIQIRAKFADGTAIASNIIKTTAARVLKEGVI